MNGRRGSAAWLGMRVGAGCVAGLLCGPAAHGQVQAGAPARPWTDWSATQQRRDEVLRAEANATYLTPRECRLVAAALAARKARAEAELAARERLRLEKRLAAAAAAERARGAGPGEQARVGAAGAADGGTMSASEPAVRPVISFVAPVPQGVGEGAPAPGHFAPLPPHRMEADAGRSGPREGSGVSLDARPLIGTAPFGVPIPGRSGYVTSPPQLPAGVIDVRGYRPGEEVVDPYTGQLIRVP